jgi:mono/diheme cytochrome c family protein
MKNNKFHPILIFVLLASIIVTGCGMQAPAELEESSEPQNADSIPVPVTEAPTVVETEASLEEPAPTEAPAEEAPVSTISFATDVLPIIESRCVNCHGGKRVEEGLYLRTYDEILAGSDHGAVVIPGDVEGSLLVELVANQEMPKRGPKLTPAQIQIISDWVAAGAANN